MPDVGKDKPRTRDATAGHKIGGGTGKENRDTLSIDKAKEKTFMDRWVEPSLAAPKASYQDHGGTPYGVLEHMQPLGEPPSAKVKARVKNEAPRKSVLGRSAAAQGMGAQDTPEGSPAPPARTHAEEAEARPTPVVDDEKDGDYAPQAGKKAERQTRPRAAKASARKSIATSDPPSQAKKESRPAVKQAVRSEAEEEKMKGIVEEAKQTAIGRGLPDLAETVHRIYLRSFDNQRLRTLMEVILRQTANKTERKEFQLHVRDVQKELKEDKEAGNPPTSGKANDRVKREPSPTPPTIALQAGCTPDMSRSGHTPDITALSKDTSNMAKPRISLKLKSAATKNNHHSAPRAASESPKKRSDSIGSESSLTSFTSNEGTTGERTPAKKTNGVNGESHMAEAASLAPPSRGTKRSSTEAVFDSEDDRAHHVPLKRAKGKAAVDDSVAYSDPDALEQERTIVAKKLKLSKEVNRKSEFEESHIRPPKEPQTRSSRSLRDRNSKLLQVTTRGISAQPGISSENLEDSPLSELSPIASAAGSLRSTPLWHGPPKPFGKRAKTKQSPEKKQVAAYGGLAASGGAGRESPVAYDDNEEGSENNDFCSACGGAGWLLCCDGCDRSFHFTCLDPPLSPDSKELNEPWYCFSCASTKRRVADSPDKPTRGLFAPLLSSLKKRNPSNFVLPQYLRDYFEGVASDKNGAFVESLQKATRHRPGYGEEIPDYYKERDSKGNLILCYHCGKSAHRQYALVTCDFCSEHWHLDCLSPPLANPPSVNQNGRKVHDWMCPLHADQELRAIDTSVLNRRKIHLRKPKNAKQIETSLTRGFRNDGIIEVLDDTSDDSDSEFYEHEGHEKGPIVFKLPAKGIVLDFIDKVKSTRVQQIRDDRAHRRQRLASPVSTTPNPLAQANFVNRSFIEQQVALNLAQFALENKDLDLGGRAVETLLATLIAEAPSDVVKQLAAAEDAERAKSVSSNVPPSPPASEQPEQAPVVTRKQIELLMELLRRKLNSIS